MTSTGDARVEARWYINTWAARTGRRVSARIIDSVAAFVVLGLVLAIGPHGRPFAQDCVVVVLVVALETTALTRWGATAGMKATQIRVAVLDDHRLPDWLTASRRSVPVALCYALLLPGTPVALVMPWAMLLSIALSPARRAFHDRLSGTVVVVESAPRLIRTTDLATWWEPGFDAVMTRWGRAPRMEERRRARAHRLDGAWWMVLVLVTATVASVGVERVPWLLLWLAIIWVALAVIDETWWVSNFGDTPGHRKFGYRIVDVGTGGAPTTRQALLRALVVVPLLYLPPLQLLGALWVHASATHRGPHDLLAGTIVVEPGFVPPRFVATGPIQPYPLAPPMPLPPPVRPAAPPPPPPVIPGPF